ncbi:restriction endonuclease subunit S [Pseudomonas guariconensis]|uniref:restriction endonuclease subunit S n=1 Tax=Pseudomonas guariconensis TaxID=1288410 RepID=UPI0025A96AAB|nr:restriction endonuclease subunit S [Pseudomonas guariconensis]MDM9593682.1 restriction endonuclease subunit S [Pseudomonas guariconensis]MDM9606509.1 restriction endonuclease subunit S [Pseudomonas guariconensis]MDM9611465.1 restriction endonuclease subunit S [Pseudomonas guariconensis]
MSSEWAFAPLEECLDALIDYRGKTPEKTSFGIPLITAKIIKNGRIEKPTEFIAVDNYDSWMRRGIPLEGDVVLTVEAPLGEVAQLGTEKIALAQRVVTLRGKKGLLDNTYLLYLLQTEEMLDQLKARATGTTVLGIKQSELRKVQLSLPPVDQQIAAARILRALDDRITLLRETNATLEAIAQALFKSWFVDFDPVRAKAEGRQPEGMDATTAALFPDSFEESELGVVPKGWSIGSVGDLASQKKGSVNPLASPDVLYEHYSLPAFDSGQAPVFELGQEIKSNKTPLPEEAVLLSKLNPHIPRVWLPVSCGANAVCSTEFLAYSPRDGASKELIYCLFGSSEFQQQLCQLVTGTSNSHQRVKPDQVLAIKLPIAGKPALKAFTESVRPLFERVHANRLQAQTLTQLRDTLLPRLISGQLRLPEAQALLNDRDIAQ